MYPLRSPPSRAYRVERAARALFACPCWKARRPGWRYWSSPPEGGGTLGGLLGTGSQEPAAGTAGCACSGRPRGCHPHRLSRLQTKVRRRCSRALLTRSRSTTLRPLPLCPLPPPRFLTSCLDRHPCHQEPETRLEGQQEGQRADLAQAIAQARPRPRVWARPRVVAALLECHLYHS